MKTPANISRAIKKYGEGTCRAAYRLNRDLWEGASTIAFQMGLKTRQADAAITAGCWLVDQTEYLRRYGE